MPTDPSPAPERDGTLGSVRTAARVLRAYRLYLAGCAVGFEQGWTLLYQVLAIRPEGKAAHAHADLNAYPFVRNFMYEPGRV